ncbi:hypothetical protein [Cellulomonas sp.]|uniref:hypothetical protein n=1 Tax=Cellulomonas sp. TaxID=40001 RepID=UPI003BA8AE1F
MDSTPTHDLERPGGRYALSSGTRRRRPRCRPGGFDPTVPLLAVAGLAGLAAVTGAILWFTDAADHRLAVTLAASGVAATAHDARIHNPCGGRYCPPEPAVRAIVELPDGPRELLLRGSDPETAGLEYDAWSPPPVGSRYHGEITVLYDPLDPARVMERADATTNLLHSDATIDGNIALVGAAVTVAALGPLVWRTTPVGSRSGARRARVR